MKCNFCNNSPLEHVFIDMINTPPSNSFLTKEQLNEPEKYFPLKVFFCEKCGLTQIDEYKSSREIFSDDYAYFSSYSRSWVTHAENYVNMITDRLVLYRNSKVMEIASNDGYLLQFFVKKGIPCFGIDPTTGTANAAKEKGITTITAFFGASFAQLVLEFEGAQDLIIGNNVLAHVPDINDFVEGLKIALAETGTITMEFPHLMKLIKYNQFDTIYHEHFSYLSLYTTNDIFAAHRLKIYDVEELPTHGGSLRIYACHAENDSFQITSAVGNILREEITFGILKPETYAAFQQRVDLIKHNFLRCLLDLKREGKKIVAYGAAAKGNTLLNYCGVKGTDLIEFVVDASPSKQGKFLPGSHIPVVSEQMIKDTKPDVIIIFPWNIKEEIVNQLKYTRDWNAKFVVAIPEVEVF